MKGFSVVLLVTGDEGIHGRLVGLDDVKGFAVFQLVTGDGGILSRFQLFCLNFGGLWPAHTS